MSTIHRKPGIPQVPQGVGQETHRFLGALKEHAEVGQGVRGNYRDRYVTLGMLISAGIITDEQARKLGQA